MIAGSFELHLELDLLLIDFNLAELANRSDKTVDSVISRCNEILPLLIRVRSRRSSINRASSCKLRLITSKSDRIASGRSGYCSITARIAKIGVSGVRNSWLRIARN